MKSLFHDRTEAGRLLADRLANYAGRPDVLVLALPRGGVPVAHVVARALGAPLDVIVVRKLGVPNHEELAFGAIGSGGVQVLNPEVVDTCGIDANTIAFVAEREARELARRELAYRGHRPPCDVRGKTVIVVDDGIATGASIRAALKVLREASPRRLIAAAPVIAASIATELRTHADDVVSVLSPREFHAVGAWYENFSQVSDRQVQTLLGPPCHPVGAPSWKE